MLKPELGHIHEHGAHSRADGCKGGNGLRGRVSGPLHSTLRNAHWEHFPRHAPE
jgi:hypothetical protein